MEGFHWSKQGQALVFTPGRGGRQALVAAPLLHACSCLLGVIPPAIHAIHQPHLPMGPALPCAWASCLWGTGGSKRELLLTWIWDKTPGGDGAWNLQCVSVLVSISVMLKWAYLISQDVCTFSPAARCLWCSQPSQGLQALILQHLCKRSLLQHWRWSSLLFRYHFTTPIRAAGWKCSWCA